MLVHWNNGHDSVVMWGGGLVITPLISELMFVVVPGSHRLVVSPSNPMLVLASYCLFACSKCIMGDNAWI